MIALEEIDPAHLRGRAQPREHLRDVTTPLGRHEKARGGITDRAQHRVAPADRGLECTHARIFGLPRSGKRLSGECLQITFDGHQDPGKAASYDRSMVELLPWKPRKVQMVRDQTAEPVCRLDQEHIVRACGEQVPVVPPCAEVARVSVILFA